MRQGKGARSSGVVVRNAPWGRRSGSPHKPRHPDRRPWPLRVKRMLRANRPLLLLLVLCLALGVVTFAGSPWPPGLTLRHIMAAPDCDLARAVRLAPSHHGQPGYYARHDADRDGIACEP